MAATAVLPELARDSQLETRITSKHFVHLFSETPTVTRKEVWERTKRIGFGGFGTVWLETCIEGHVRGNDSFRAVKVLQLPSDIPPQEAIVKCGRELEALAKFSQRKYSKCFVKSYGWYQGPSSSISICLEYLPFGDLRAFLSKRADPTLGEPEVQQIISQVLDGLVFMHAEGFAHRDLKPANILIKSHEPTSWWVKLSDFGLSKRNETMTGASLQGTPGFMAPELLGYLVSDYSKTQVMSCPADLWSLGEITFQLATGKAVFPDQAKLAEYTLGKLNFPAFELQNVMASPEMVEFVTATMLADYTKRPTAAVASAYPWLQTFKTASFTLPSRAISNSRDNVSSGMSSALDQTVSSEIDYRPWSTVTSATAISPPFASPKRPTPETSRGAGTVPKAVSVRNTGSNDSVNGLATPPHLATKALVTETIDALLGPSADELAQVIDITAFTGIQTGGHQAIFSPDSKKLITTSPNHRLCLWSIKDKTLLRTIKGAGDYVAFSPDSERIAAVKQHGPVCVLDASLTRRGIGSRVCLRGSVEEACCVAFSPLSGQVAVGTSKGTIFVWATNRDKTPQKIKTRSRILWVTYYPRGEATNECDIVAIGVDGSISFWRFELRLVLSNRWVCISERKLSLIGNSNGYGGTTGGDVSAAASSKLFSRLAIARANGSIEVWCSGEARHWSLGLKREWGSQGHNERVSALDFSPNSKLLVSASRGSVRIWKVPGGLPVAVVRAQGRLVFRTVAFSPNSASLVSTSSDKCVRIWDVGGIRNLSDIQDHLDQASFVAVSPDRRYVASITRKLHNIGLGKSKPHHSPADQHLSIDNDFTTIMIWDVEQARPITLIREIKEGALSVAFSTDSERVGSVSVDHVLRIWDVGTGECLETTAPRPDAMERIPCVALSADLSYCASVVRYRVERNSRYGGTYMVAISLCHIRLDKQRSRFSHLWKSLTTRHVADDILAITFSPDVTKLAAVDQSNRVTIWDIASGSTTTHLSNSERTPSPSLSSSLFQSGRFKLSQQLLKDHVYTPKVDSPWILFSSSSKDNLVPYSGLGSEWVWNIESGGQPLLHIESSITVSNPKKQHSNGHITSQYSSWSGWNTGAFTYRSYKIPLAVSPDGTRCVMSTKLAQQQVALWDMLTGEMVMILTRYTRSRDICHASFSPDSRWLVTASSEDMVVHEAATGREHMQIMVGLSVPLRTMAVWPDSKHVVSGCNKGMLQFWDMESGAMVKDFEGHTGRRSFVL